MTEHMVAVFASEADAAAAERELEQAGVPRAAIRRYAEGGSSTPDAAARPESVETIGRPAGGFWSWLLGLGEDTEVIRQSYPNDSGAYDRSLASGHYVLSVAVADDSKIHGAVTILERHDPLDIDEHTEEDTPAEAGARSSVAVSGTDYSSGATAAPATGGAPSGASAGDRAATQRSPGTARGATGQAAGASTAPSTGSASSSPSATPESGRDAADRTAAGREEVIPLAEEQLEVCTRSVDRGTRRVRRYAVEEPVDRDVTLHGERVTVERRRPTETRADAPESAFEERVVEVHETEEVPEVRKTARVVEEVAIRREQTERKERVHDTVRRDEVEMAPDSKDKRQQG